MLECPTLRDVLGIALRKQQKGHPAVKILERLEQRTRNQ